MLLTCESEAGLQAEVDVGRVDERAEYYANNNSTNSQRIRLWLDTLEVREVGEDVGDGRIDIGLVIRLEVDRVSRLLVHGDHGRVLGLVGRSAGDVRVGSHSERRPAGQGRPGLILGGRLGNGNKRDGARQKRPAKLEWGWMPIIPTTWAREGGNKEGILLAPLTRAIVHANPASPASRVIHGRRLTVGLLLSAGCNTTWRQGLAHRRRGSRLRAKRSSCG